MSEAHSDISHDNTLLMVKLYCRIHTVSSGCVTGSTVHSLALVIFISCHNNILHSENIADMLILSYCKLIIDLRIITELPYISFLSSNCLFVGSSAHRISKYDLRLIHLLPPLYPYSLIPLHIMSTTCASASL